MYLHFGPRAKDGRLMTYFRNLDFDSSLPLDEWQAEAIETLIDRGSLSDWRLPAETIRRNPWGPVAHNRERGGLA